MIPYIFYHQFTVFLTNGKREWNWRRFFGFGICPIILGMLFSLLLELPDSYSPFVFTCLFAIASLNLMLMIGLAVSTKPVDPDKKYDAGEISAVNQELDRIRVFQELNATIVYSIALIVIFMISYLMYLFPPTPETARGFLKFVLCTIGISTFITFSDVVYGIFQLTESYAENMKRQMISNTAKDENNTENEVSYSVDE